jgi:hypothetical protein
MCPSGRSVFFARRKSITAGFSASKGIAQRDHTGRAKRKSKFRFTPISPNCALELGLENAFIQTLESQQTYLPDFDRPAPFAS